MLVDWEGEEDLGMVGSTPGAMVVKRVLRRSSARSCGSVKCETGLLCCCFKAWLSSCAARIVAS